MTLVLIVGDSDWKKPTTDQETHLKKSDSLQLALINGINRLK